MSAEFLHYELTILPSRVNEYLGGHTLKLCKSFDH